MARLSLFALLVVVLVVLSVFLAGSCPLPGGSLLLSPRAASWFPAWGDAWCALSSGRWVVLSPAGFVVAVLPW